jgi:hypothetical protein
VHQLVLQTTGFCRRLFSGRNKYFGATFVLKALENIGKFAIGVNVHDKVLIVIGMGDKAPK